MVCEAAVEKMLPVLGEEGVSRLAAASVAVFGCGGVGSSCAEALARAGVGRLALVDGDAVAESNLNRQAIAFTSTVGRRKVEVMAAMVRDINPACQVFVRDVFVLAEDVDKLFGDMQTACGAFDYVVDALDSVSVKLALAHVAEQRGFPLISSMGAAMKTRPECLRVADISQTVNCRLSRIMRKECRRRGIRRLEVLYSCEEVPAATAPPGTERRARSGMGTMPYMPPIMGQMIAGHVIRRIAGIEDGGFAHCGDPARQVAGHDR